MRDPEKRRVGARRRYEANKVAFHARSKAYREEIRAFVYQQKIGLSCIRCGISDPRVLDFHHRDSAQKLLQLSTASKTHTNRERILAEIAKCDPICANCHRILNWEQRNGHDQ